MGKIPPQAKRVFEGVIFDVYQWEQTLYDGSTATFEKLRRADTVVIMATNNKKLLLIQDEQPDRPTVVTFPGGRVDPGENPLEGAKREFLEETGYEAQSWEEFAVFEPSHKIDWKLFFYIARNIRKAAEPDPGVGEIITTQWMTFDQFLDEMKKPDFQESHLALHLLRMSPAELDTFRQRLGV